MPTYEYKCADCGADLEIIQSIHDPALTECSECGGTLRKQFGNVGVVFKGSGFYKTDSRKHEKSSTQSASKPTKSDSTPTKPKGDAKKPGTSNATPTSSSSKKTSK